MIHASDWNWQQVLGASGSTQKWDEDQESRTTNFRLLFTFHYSWFLYYIMCNSPFSFVFSAESADRWKSIASCSSTIYYLPSTNGKNACLLSICSSFSLYIHITLSYVLCFKYILYRCVHVCCVRLLQAFIFYWISPCIIYSLYVYVVFHHNFLCFLYSPIFYYFFI